MNHNILWAKYNALTIESVKKELMKNYMLSLKPSELDSFIFSNITDIRQGVDTAELSQEDKIEISNEVDKIINLIESSKRVKIAA